MSFQLLPADRADLIEDGLWVACDNPALAVRVEHALRATGYLPLRNVDVSADRLPGSSSGEGVDVPSQAARAGHCAQHAGRSRRLQRNRRHLASLSRCYHGIPIEARSVGGEEPEKNCAPAT